MGMSQKFGEPFEGGLRKPVLSGGEAFVDAEITGSPVEQEGLRKVIIDRLREYIDREGLGRPNRDKDYQGLDRTNIDHAKILLQIIEKAFGKNSVYAIQKAIFFLNDFEDNAGGGFDIYHHVRDDDFHKFRLKEIDFLLACEPFEYYEIHVFKTVYIHTIGIASGAPTFHEPNYVRESDVVKMREAIPAMKEYLQKLKERLLAEKA